VNELPTETEKIEFHPNWLRFMYAYTIVVAGFMGLSFLIMPSSATSIFGFPEEEPIIAGLAASTGVAFAILSIAGLRSPVKFSPVLLLQLTYKAIWFIAVIIPKLAMGQLPSYAIMSGILYATFVIGDLIALPFRYLLKK
jgi:hypothetical protein